jgi:hypothetical protein
VNCNRRVTSNVKKITSTIMQNRKYRIGEGSVAAAEGGLYAPDPRHSTNQILYLNRANLTLNVSNSVNMSIQCQS